VGGLTGRPLHDRRVCPENVVGSEFVLPVRRLGRNGFEAWAEVIAQRGVCQCRLTGWTCSLARLGRSSSRPCRVPGEGGAECRPLRHDRCRQMVSEEIGKFAGAVA